MTRVWEMLRTRFRRLQHRPRPASCRASLVALIVEERDRSVLSSVSSLERLDVRFAESCEEACSTANQLTAPVILLDRDWPESEWRTTVQRLKASPHRACVILVSGVSDVYLWEEVIRRGGYEVLPKPLQADKVTRTLKLALSYWTSSSASRVLAGKV